MQGQVCSLHLAQVQTLTLLEPSSFESMDLDSSGNAELALNIFTHCKICIPVYKNIIAIV